MKLNMGYTQFFVSSGYLGRAWGWYGGGGKKDQQGENRGGGKGWERFRGMNNGCALGNITNKCPWSPPTQVIKQAVSAEVGGP